MSSRSRSTVKMLCAKATIMNQELPEEAQKLLELYDDPDVPPEQKQIVKRELDDLIQRLEDRVATTRRIKGEFSGGKP